MSGWWLIHREAEKAPLLSFQKLIEAENTPLSPQTFFFLNSVGGTAEKKFYGLSLPAPRDRKKETRCSLPTFSRGGNLEGFDFSSRGRAGNSRGGGLFVSTFFGLLF